MINWNPVLDQLAADGQQVWSEQLRNQSDDWLVHHGDFDRWNRALGQLPAIECNEHHFDRSAITVEGVCQSQSQLQQALKGLMPWRKGPYQISDVYIDCEWRSDFKWQRLLPHLSPIANHRVLDVGCGNGYHCWRMLAENPKLVIGIEPSVLFNLQFLALKHTISQQTGHGLVDII